MKKGDFVKIDYVGRLETGEIFDLTDEALAKKENIYNSNISYKPIPVIIGENFVIKGLDKELEKMKVGEKKKITVNPEDGFGKRNPNLVKIVNKKVFKEAPKVGMVVNIKGTMGRIQSIDGGRVRIDFNNPLSGKALQYEIEIKEELKDPIEKIKAIFEFFGNSQIDVSIKEGIVEVKKAQNSPDTKKKISNLIKKYIESTKTVKFVEEY